MIDMKLLYNNNSDHMMLKEQLLKGRARIGVWGCGYIGQTTAIAFAARGVKALCYDIDRNIVEQLRSGQSHIPNLEYWLGFPVAPLARDGLLDATDERNKMADKDLAVHFIAVPTEKDGEPYDAALIDVVDSLKQINPNLVIIESTLTANKIDELNTGSLPVGVAPRRDWFSSPEQNLQNLARIYAGPDLETNDKIRDVLSIVCNNLIAASSRKVATLVKAVENSLLHLPAVYAMQLARAYPNLDVLEVLNLASTHWRINKYFSSMGTGGYCIPLSSKYVLDGAEKQEELSLLREAVKYDREQPSFVADLLTCCGARSVAILGITYKGDLKVHTLSPALTIISHARENGIKVGVYDPYYTEEELLKITGAATISFPEDLKSYDAIIIVPDHRVFRQIPSERLFSRLRKDQIILDNLGVWEHLRSDLEEHGLFYRRIGDRNWSTLPRRTESTQMQPNVQQFAAGTVK